MNAKGIVGLIVFSVLATAHADFTNGLIAYYPFNGNSIDESANGRSLTNSGAVLTLDRFGFVNSAYSFNGSNSFLLETNAADSLVLFNGFTISCWVNLSTNSRNYSLVRKDGDASMVIVNQQTKVNSFYVETRGSNALGSMVYSGKAQAPPLGQWCMLTATWDGTNFAQYVNGQKKPTSQISGTGTGPKANISIGRSPVYFEPLLGRLDDARIYNRALTALDVQQLYQYEAAPSASTATVSFIKAFTLDYGDLTPGLTYQPQVSTDLKSWTNYGAAFTATSFDYTNPTYQRIADWDKLFFRLLVFP